MDEIVSKECGFGRSLKGKQTLKIFRVPIVTDWSQVDSFVVSIDNKDKKEEGLVTDDPAKH